MIFLRSLRSLIRRRRVSIDSSNAANSYKAELERNIDALENWAHVGAAVVVIGVIVEYKTPLLTFLQTWSIAVLAPAIGGILIAIGVGLEMLMGILASGREHKLRDINAKEVAELNLHAEQERHARVKIEERIADRSVSDEQSARIVGSLKPFAEQLFTITVPFITRELLQFTGTLFKLFERAGWKQGIIAIRDSSNTEMLAGVTIWTHGIAAHGVLRAAEATVSAFNAEGIMTHGPYIASLESVPVHIKEDNRAIEHIRATIIINIGLNPK